MYLAISSETIYRERTSEGWGYGTGQDYPAHCVWRFQRGPVVSMRDNYIMVIPQLLP